MPKMMTKLNHNVSTSGSPDPAASTWRATDTGQVHSGRAVVTVGEDDVQG